MKKSIWMSSSIFALATLTAQLTFGQTVATPAINTTIGAGARAFGMGGAFIAIADDATAASWNPAGLAQLEKPEVSFVFSALNDFDTTIPSYSSGIFNSDQQFSNSGRSIDFFSFAYPFKKHGYKFVPQISYQRVINLSLDTKLDQNVSFDQILIINDKPTEIEGVLGYDEESSGGFDVVSASLGIEASDTFRFGAALNFWLNGSETSGTNNVNFTAPTTGNVRTVTDTNRDISGFNASLGALMKPKENVSLGVVFRTPFNLNHDITITERSFVDGILSDSMSVSQSNEIEFPYSFGFGGAVRATDQLTVSADFTLTNWSDSKIVADNAESEFPGNGDRGQEDTKQLRLGAEYILIYPDLIIPLRGGFFTNTVFFTDYNNDRVTNFGFTFGGGVGIRDFLFDVAVVIEKGDWPIAPGTNSDFSAKQIFTSVIYRFAGL